jgi:hypothetical protein
MAEHHALISVHHEVIRPPHIQHLPSYKAKTAVTADQPSDVGKKALHAISDHLSSRFPYPEPARFNYLEPTVAYGREGVRKTMNVLRELIEQPPDAAGVVELKRANISKLLEALYDHTTIADAVASENTSDHMALLKDLLSDPDSDVKRGTAEVLGRFSGILQGRKAICASGCAESLAFMLEDPDSADVRLAAGKTLHMVTQVC